MLAFPPPRGDPTPYPRLTAVSVVMVALIVILFAFSPLTCIARAGTMASAAPEDTAGMSLLQWSYDSWTVPWVQVRGTSSMLAAASHATLMALTCETANLERDRLARHLSAEECEHRMAGIRADQDSALIFRLDLRVFDYRGADAFARLDPRVTLTLEDDQGRRWQPIEVRRGPAVLLATGQKLKRVYYYPPWIRGTQRLYPTQYEVADGRNLTASEHRVRFARRDPRAGDLVIAGETRWIRLRLGFAGNEWIASWAFRPEERP